MLSLPAYQPGRASTMPRVFSLDPAALVRVKNSIGTNNPTIDAALAALYKKAKSALKSGPFSVMDKSIVPPSGDKHDFMSLSRYWWPNPNTPDGLPYVR